MQSNHIELFEPRTRLHIKKQVDLESIKSILVIGIDQLGGLMYSTPFFRELRLAFPNARIVNLVGPLTAGIMKNCPYVDDVWLFNKKESWQTVKKMKQENFDLAFIPAGTLRTSLMAYLAKIPNRVAYDDDGNGFLLTVRLHQELHSRYRPENIFDMLRAIGITPKGVYEREIWLTEADRDYARKWLNSFQHTGRKILAFNPFSTDPKRRWTDQGWSELLMGLKEHHITPVMMVAPNEMEQAKDLLNQWHVEGIAVESHAVMYTAAILEQVDYVIGPESGFVHMALAVNKPHVIAFFNVLPPQSTFPIADQHHKALIEESVACAPCYLYKFKDVCPYGIECMKQLSSTRVLGVIAEFEKCDNIT